MINDTDDYPVKRKWGIMKVLLIAGGILCVALGVIGIFVPILPTTPFLLIAAVCFARSSERFYRWLITNRWFGEYIKNYREGKGISLKRKVFAISLLWVTIGYSALVVANQLWIKLLLWAIAVGVTIHLLKIRTYQG